MQKCYLNRMLSVLQCERKEEYIEKIQSLDFDTQAAIAAHIQEVLQSIHLSSKPVHFKLVWRLLCAILRCRWPTVRRTSLICTGWRWRVCVQRNGKIFAEIWASIWRCSWTSETASWRYLRKSVWECCQWGVAIILTCSFLSLSAVRL